MSFTKGVSGNPKGRPRETPQQKEERDYFKSLLKSSTVSALQSIISISQDRYNKDRFNACRYLIDKAYGANTAFLMDGMEDASPVFIVLRQSRRERDEDWDAEWNAAPDKDDLENCKEE